MPTESCSMLWYGPNHSITSMRSPIDTLPQTIIIARRSRTLSKSFGQGLAPLLGLQASDLTTHIQLAERAIPPSLNMAELSLLIASKHLTEEEKPVNFVIAYERYIDHCKRAAASGTSSSRAFSRGLCLRVSW
jgi:hypothetical protein